MLLNLGDGFPEQRNHFIGEALMFMRVICAPAILLMLGALLMPVSESQAQVCGDVNGDNSVDIADVLFLVDYSFNSGPRPVCNPGSVTDIDGNVYQTVTIGTQVWTVENLKVTHFRNGYGIAYLPDSAAWHDLDVPAYCIHSHPEVYGLLYNWYAVHSSQGLAPEGWHIPSDDEWKQLELYLGMTQEQADGSGSRGTDEGGKLKEVGTTHWTSPNTGATNASGFTALPAGTRSGLFGGLGDWTRFWTSSQHAGLPDEVWYRELYFRSATITRSVYMRTGGFSVRCVKD